MTTISASSTIGINLNPATYVNPVIINAGVTISNSIGIDAVYVSGAAYVFTIQNDGLISGPSASGGIGVSLASGGSVTNAASASITAGGDGIVIGGATGTVVNDGSIAATGTSGNGIALISGGSVTNAASGSITGAHWGVDLSAGGYVTNAAAGTISGVGNPGVEVTGAAGTVENAGVIINSGSTNSAIGMHDGGYVSNAASGMISGGGGFGVFVSGAAGTVVNSGSIAATGTSGEGVYLGLGGSVTNAASASITGYRAVEISGSAGTVVNDGSIASTGTLLIPTLSPSGVDLSSGGSVTNAASASITGDRWGVYVLGRTGTVVNDGSIAATGPTAAGVDLGSGGSVTNAAFGSIMGGAGGIYIDGGTGTVVNDGSIAGGGFRGIVLLSGGSITNATSASIKGFGFGAGLYADGTLTNAGTIIGNSGTAVHFAGTGNNLLVLDPSYGFSGLVVGSPSASNTLELASAASAGTVTGLGTEFVNFGSIVIDAGAQWTIGGDTSGLAGTISDFTAGDTIELTGITATGSSYVGGILTLDEAVGSATLDLPGGFTTTSFNVTNNSDGTEVTIAPCFRAGTRLLTASGEVAVEALAPGDMVVTLSGHRRPVRWIGHRRVDCRTHPQPGKILPVRVRAGAFGVGKPRRDLYLSPDHAVFAEGDGEGVLIPIRLLVNGTTIAQAAAEEVTYYHVELASHDVVFAEGLAAETYLDTANRDCFDNGHGAVRLHPVFEPADAFGDMVWEVLGYAPLVVVGPELDRVRAHLTHLAGKFARAAARRGHRRSAGRTG
jgi:hypothetical protein